MIFYDNDDINPNPFTERSIKQLKPISEIENMEVYPSKNYIENLSELIMKNFTLDTNKLIKKIEDNNFNYKNLIYRSITLVPVRINLNKITTIFNYEINSPTDQSIKYLKEICSGICSQ